MSRKAAGVGLAIALGLAAVASGAGCSVPTEASTLGLVNSCSDDSDCVGDAVCAQLSSGSSCVAVQSDLSNIVFEVRTIGSSTGSSISRILDQGFLVPQSDADGLVVDHNLQLPPLVELSGQVLVGQSDDRCAAPDGSLPARLEARPVSVPVGVAELYQASTKVGADGTSHAFSARLPPGVYDLIIRPESCDELPAAPPRLVSGVELAVDSTLDLELSAVSRLTGSVDLPDDADESGPWTLEVVEPSYGWVVSQSVQLPTGSGTVSIDGLEGTGEGLAFTWTEGQLIRLRDEDGGLVVHWALSAVDLNADGEVELKLTDLEVTPKPIEATVVDELGNPVPATVKIQSAGLTGSASNNASLTVSATSDDAGLFAAELVPGDYILQAFPLDDEQYGASQTAWTIAESDLCCGRTLTVPNRSVLRGLGLSPTSEGIENASVEVVPTKAGKATYFDTALNPQPLLPSTSFATTNTSGEFQVSVEPSLFDLFVKPQTGSSFPWHVRPSTLVSAEESDITQLGVLTVPYPVVVQGNISNAIGEGVAATVRAYVAVSATSPTELAQPRFIQIGEAQASENGQYQLLLPPQLSASP